MNDSRQIHACVKDEQVRHELFLCMHASNGFTVMRCTVKTVNNNRQAGRQAGRQAI